MTKTAFSVVPLSLLLVSQSFAQERELSLTANFSTAQIESLLPDMIAAHEDFLRKLEQGELERREIEKSDLPAEQKLSLMRAIWKEKAAKDPEMQKVEACMQKYFMGEMKPPSDLAKRILEMESQGTTRVLKKIKERGASSAKDLIRVEGETIRDLLLAEDDKLTYDAIDKVVAKQLEFRECQTEPLDKRALLHLNGELARSIKRQAREEVDSSIKRSNR